MKKLLVFITLISMPFLGFSINDPYTKAMTEGMNMLSEAKGPQDFIETANKFERISMAEEEKWHPAYYASYAMTVAAAMEQDMTKRDEHLDKAQGFLDKALAVEHDIAEVQALQGFIYMIRIGVDPASRGQQYSGMSGAALQKAKTADPDNPRVLYLLAQLSYGTAQFFGSDSSEACKLNDQALEKFNAAEGEETRDPFAPKWGKSMAEGFKVQCGN